LIFFKNLCGKCLCRNFHLNRAAAIAERHQTVRPHAEFAAFQPPFRARFILIYCPLTSACLRVEFDDQNLFLFSDCETALSAVIDKRAAFNSAKIVRRYIRAHQRNKRNPKLKKNSLVADSFTHLSISPRTMSMDPITATTSAISRPSHMVCSACNVANDGFRMCTRYGLAVPSLTAK